MSDFLQGVMLGSILGGMIMRGIVLLLIADK